MRTSAEMSSVSQGTRNMAEVDKAFAIVYWIEDTGRLMTNPNACLFRSFKMDGPGSRLPRIHTDTKNHTLPRTRATSPAYCAITNAIRPTPMEMEMSRRLRRQSFKIRWPMTELLTLPPPRGCVLHWRRKSLPASCSRCSERGRRCVHRHGQDRAQRHWRWRLPVFPA